VSHRARRPLLSRLGRPWVAILAVTAIAAGVRLWGLAQPAEMIFDENYYAKAACIYVGLPNPTCDVESENELLFYDQQWDVGSYVHPPLGKWGIALGIKAFGMDAFGWRVGSAVVGTLTVTVVAALAWLLFGSVLWTFLAGLLLATEHLSVVLSRLALLDAHLTFWVSVGFLCLVLDRRWIDRRTPAEPAEDGVPTRVPSPLWRPWRYATGLAMGGALAVKWSGAFAILAVAVLSVMWETTRRRRAGAAAGRAFGRTLLRESFGLAVAFVVVPVAVYVAAYLPWLHHFDWDVGRLVDTHASALDFHLDLRETAVDPSTGEMTPTHYAYSRPWSWLAMTRPVRITWNDLGTDVREIVAVGNPVIFWGGIWALPYLAFAWWRKRDWAPGFLLLAVLLQYAPWLAVARPQFSFYVAPFAPFLVLGVAWMLRELADARLVVREPGGEVAVDPTTGRPAVSTWHPYRPVAVTALVAAVALFAWFYPVLTWMRISDTHQKLILWFPGWR
jgi:dolichyl-phosphate-mannose--protein O-mannosyl transferase